MKNKRFLFTALFSMVLSVALGGTVAAERMQVVFEDDFSEGVAKWLILEDDYGTIMPGPNNDYLQYGHFGVNVHMRIPDIITNNFDLLVDLDLNTGSLDWFGFRFGTESEAEGVGPGHLVFIRPTGQVQLWRQPPDSWKHGSSDEHFTLGYVAPFSAATEILLKVRPNKFEIHLQDEVFVFDDITVEPGYVDFYSMNPGPVRLYYVELSIPVE